MAKTSTTTDESQPLADLESAERAVDPPMPEPETGADGGFVVPESDAPHVLAALTNGVPATARLRAFEDKHLGADAVRIGGHVERGVGSPYAKLSPARHRHYEALEKLVASEQKLAAAHTALIQADVEHEEAMAAAARAESDADAPPAA